MKCLPLKIGEKNNYMECTVVKKNNKGFTLIEIIVVIAIIAVLSTGVFLTAKLVHLNRMKEAISDIAALLSTCKMSSVTGQAEAKTELEISYVENKGYIAQIILYEYAANLVDGNKAIIKPGTVKLEEFLGKGFDLTYTDDSGKHNIKDGTLIICYDRQTAKLVGTQVTEIAAEDRYKIEIHPLTGYHE